MRKNLFNDERMMLRVSDLYYNQKMSQQEIADKLNISRPTISKLLASARNSGIVTITVSDLSGRKYFQLEQALEEKYNLKEVFIVESNSDSSEVKSAIGEATAQYLSRIIQNGDVIGVSMGTTIAQLAPNYNGSCFNNLTFVPLIGGVGTVENDLHSNYVSESLSRSFGGTYLPLHVPAMVSRTATKTELMKEASVQSVFRKAAKMDIALLGIGSLNPSSTVIKTGYITPQFIDEMQKKDICGDICMKFYDETGDTSQFEENEKVISVDLDVLHNTEYSIGICGGAAKAKAVYGAINGGYINVLITDYACAQKLAEYSNK